MFSVVRLCCVFSCANEKRIFHEKRKLHLSIIFCQLQDSFNTKTVPKSFSTKKFSKAIPTLAISFRENVPFSIFHFEVDARRTNNCQRDRAFSFGIGLHNECLRFRVKLVTLQGTRARPSVSRQNFYLLLAILAKLIYYTTQAPLFVFFSFFFFLFFSPSLPKSVSTSYVNIRLETAIVHTKLASTKLDT